MVKSTSTQVTADGHDFYPCAIRETLGSKVKYCCSAYANRRIERDHREVKQQYYPMLGFGAPAAAFGPAILSSLRGSSTVLSVSPRTERSDLTLRRQTAISLRALELESLFLEA